MPKFHFENFNYQIPKKMIGFDVKSMQQRTFWTSKQIVTSRKSPPFLSGTFEKNFQVVQRAPSQIFNHCPKCRFFSYGSLLFVRTFIKFCGLHPYSGPQNSMNLRRIDGFFLRCQMCAILESNSRFLKQLEIVSRMEKNSLHITHQQINIHTHPHRE